jgi:Protein of unknown function (DUF2934)
MALAPRRDRAVMLIGIKFCPPRPRRMNEDAAAQKAQQRATTAEVNMTQRIRTKAVHQKHASPPAAQHPRSVATITLEAEAEQYPEQPFAEGLKDELDPELRYRVISEAAFHRQAQRGYDEGYERDDWLDAEAEVDHIVIGAKLE